MKVLEMRGITKRFPGVLANDRIDLEVRKGEILALLGENGAGKSTLMNILYGLYQPDQGGIFLRGGKVEIRSTADAVRLGIGMIHQHFMLVPQLTAFENIIAGLVGNGLLLRLDKLRKAILDLSESHQLKIELDRPVWQLSVGERQRVEIIKALFRGADLLIMDEPTALLTPQETDKLFAFLRSLTRDGKTVIFISHKLDEVMAISDRVQVLRHGRDVGTVETRDTDPATLARMMVGREVLIQVEKTGTCRKDLVMKLDGVSALGDSGLPALKQVSLEIWAGEILGIAGVDGNGQHELAEVVTGLRRTTAGRLFHQGREVTGASPRRMITGGVAHIPAGREETGAILDFSVCDNLILELYRSRPYRRGPLLLNAVIRAHALRLVQEFGVKVPGIDVPANLLSGGNLQKVILARQFSREPNFLVAAQPTRGLDVGAIEYVQKKLVEAQRRGAAILLISTELDEILRLSDRIAVIHGGEIMGIIPAGEVDLEELGLMMAGALRRGEGPSRGHQEAS